MRQKLQLIEARCESAECTAATHFSEVPAVDSFVGELMAVFMEGAHPPNASECYVSPETAGLITGLLTTILP